MTDSGFQAHRIVPFGLAGLLPFLLLPLPGPTFDLTLTIVGAVLTLGVCAGCMVTPWHRLTDWWTLVPTAGYLIALSILRDAGGGNVSGLGPLALVPVVWLSLFGTRRTLVAAIVGVALVYWIPVVLTGGDVRYPSSGWRIGVLLACMGALISSATLGLRTQLDRQTTRVRAMALQDELTGLPNRRAWDDALVRALSRASREAEPVCVALVDIDGFKAVNDAAGHAAGDDLLETLAGSWGDSLRTGDTLARVGGDEFGVLLPGVALDEAVEALERLRQAAAANGASCSIGVVAWDRVESPDGVMARADALMYQAKAAGRDQIRAQALTLGTSAYARP
jgi:diguanylate cyclase (GGDEF)-like protein